MTKMRLYYFNQMTFNGQSPKADEVRKNDRLLKLLKPYEPCRRFFELRDYISDL